MVTDAQTHAKSECITQPSGSLIHIWIRQHWNYGGARYRLVRDHPVPPPPLCKSNGTGLDLPAPLFGINPSSRGPAGSRHGPHDPPHACRESAPAAVFGDLFHAFSYLFRRCICPQFRADLPHPSRQVGIRFAPPTNARAREAQAWWPASRAGPDCVCFRNRGRSRTGCSREYRGAQHVGVRMVVRPDDFNVAALCQFRDGPLGGALRTWVQQASRRKTGLGASASGPGADLTQNVPLGSRVVAQKVNFWGQGNKGSLISSAVRRRTGEYPPGRLLLPGGLCCRVLRISISPKVRASLQT